MNPINIIERLDQIISDSPPLVSILIPNYNKASYLKETLDSVFSQHYTNWECIVVDDHSTDHSWEILEKYAALDCRYRIYRRPDHLPGGGNAARNYAFFLSIGKYVNWFDSDDLMKPGFISTKIEYFNRFECDAVISKMNRFENGIEVETTLIPSFDDIIEDYLVKDIHFLTSGPLFKRCFLSGKDLFNPKVKVGQEKEFYFRLLCQGMRFVVIDQISGVYFNRKESILDTYSNKKVSFEHWRYRYCMICSVFKYDVDFRNYKPLINFWAYKVFSLSLKEWRLYVSFKMLAVLIKNKISV